MIESPTMADVLHSVKVSRKSTKAKRELRRNVKRGCRWLGIPPSQLRACPRELAERFNSLSPGKLGVSPKRFTNVKTSFRGALAIHEPTTQLQNAHGHEWEILFGSVAESSEKYAVSRFARYATRENILPPDIDAVVSSHYGEWLSNGTMVSNPRRRHRMFIHAWNYFAATEPAWPKTQLPLPATTRRYRVTKSAFPEQLRKDIAAFLAAGTADDPFDLKARATPLKTATTKTYENTLWAYSSALTCVDVPIEGLTSARELVRRPNIEKGLRFYLDRSGKTKSVAAFSAARAAAAIGRWLLTRDADITDADKADLVRDLEWLDEVSRRVKPRSGLSAENRERTRPFKDERELSTLYLLPHALLKAVEKVSAPDLQHVFYHQVVLAMLLLSYCPLRITSLATLRIDTHLRWTLPDYRGRLSLVFAEGELKNGEPCEFPLPELCAAAIRRYLLKTRPLMCGPENPYLFPGGRAGKPRAPSRLSLAIKRAIFKSTGHVVNAHLYRHLVHLVILRRYPGAYAMVARVLGHRSLETTVENYSAFDAELSLEAYQSLVSDSIGMKVRAPKTPARHHYDIKSE